MSSVDLKEYKELYLSTAKEYIKKLKNAIVSEPLSPESISDIYLSAHSLKSQSLVMGFISTGTLCLELEKMFKSIKENNNTRTIGDTSVVQTVLKSLEKSIRSIEQSGTELDLSSEIEKLRHST